MSDDGEFTFPRHMPIGTAQELLAESYRELDEGKILRRTNKALRKAGIDPPMHVQYVAEPAVAPSDDGRLGIVLNCDIMIYEEFPEMQACIDAFESTLGEMLLDRLDRHVKKWLRRHPSPAA